MKNTPLNNWLVVPGLPLMGIFLIAIAIYYFATKQYKKRLATQRFELT